jgi:hypothetical protein
MKTLTKNNLSLYVFDDSKTLTITEDNIIVGDPADFIISDCNSNNTVLHENVTEPEDWRGCKYLFVDGVWSISPNWEEPSESIEG